MEVGLLEVKVDFLALVASSWAEVGKNLSLQATSEGIIELDFGVEEVGGIP